MSRTADIHPAAYLIALEDKPGGALLAASVRDILLRIPDVCAVTGLSMPTIYRLMTRGEFPRPLKITRAARAWRLSEITAWVDSRDREHSWPGDGPNEPGPSVKQTGLIDNGTSPAGNGMQAIREQNCDER